MRLLSLLITLAIGVAVGVAIAAEAMTVSQAAIAAGVAIVVWFVGYLTLAKFHAKRFNAESVMVMGLLGRGEHDKAAKAWTRWGRGVTVPAVVIAAARHNVAWVTLRRGQLREALELFAANERQHLRWLKASHIDSVSALDRALCSALLGNLEAARHALAEAGMRSTSAHLSYLPMKAFVDAVIACREDRAAVAAKQLDENWVEYESQATGDVTRPLRVVRAFAIAAQGPRTAGQVEPLINAARPAYPGEYAFLAVAWPEMAVFLTSHGLS